MSSPTDLANTAAQSAYYKALANNQGANQALQQAMFEWQKKLDEATQTGMWNGQWNNPQEQWFTGQFGQWFGAGGAPQVGQKTLTAEEQAQQNAQAWSGMFGQYLAPGTAPTQGQQTFEAQQAQLQNANQLAQIYGSYYAPGQAPGAGTQTQSAQQQAWQQGFSQQQFQAQQAQLAQQNAQQYLQLLSSLRGPADWAKYQQVLGSTPGGMRDLYAAAMGQYTPGGGATTGMQPQAADLNTMQQQIAGGPAWGSGIGVGQQGASPDQAVQATGNGTNMYGGQQQQYNLPAPNQIAPQSWNNFTPSQQQLMLGNYEAAGYDKNDVMALYNQGLPKYGSNNATAGTWRLQ